MFDDHEIINDYAPAEQETDLYDEAIPPFNNYQLSANPRGIDAIQRSYFTFNIGQVAFFVLDNRSYRSPQPLRTSENSTAGWGERTMLGDTQMRHLRVWAAVKGEHEKRLLVVVSGVPFTRNWSKGGDEFDSWAVSRVAVRELNPGLSHGARRDSIVDVGSRGRSGDIGRPPRAW
jgi:alkaline phosphatase D